MKLNAAEILHACGTRDLPELAATVPVRVPPWWIRVVLRRRFAAITLPWGVYVRRDLLDSPESLERLMLHELAHVEQWRRLGYVRFLRVYLGEYFAARRSGASHMVAYYDISLESEARAAAGQT